MAAGEVIKNAAEPILGFRRSDKTSSYQMVFKEIIWLMYEQVNSVTCNINFVLDFLTKLLGENVKDFTINSHRSPKSDYHSHVDGKLVEQHPQQTFIYIFNNF